MKADREPLRVAQWVRIRWWNACAWYAVTLAEALARRGHLSFLLAPSETPAWAEASARGLPTPRLGDLGSFRPREWIRAGRDLKKLAGSERIQLINVHSGRGHLRLALFCSDRGIPLVRTRGDIRAPGGRPAQRWLYRSLTTHHLAAAEFIRRDHLLPMGIPGERITTLRGGIDLARLAELPVPFARVEARTRLKLPAGAKLAGMIGRLSPVKGHIDFLNAMSRLIDRHPDLHLLVVGPEAEITGDEIREWAVSLGLVNRVHVLGRVPDPLFWAAALDVAVIASIDSEAICRSALEYLGLGIPLVATRVHALSELLVEGTGLLVREQDPDGLAAAVELLLASEDLRSDLSRAGREHVRAHYSLERFGEEAEGLFRRLIEGGKR